MNKRIIAKENNDMLFMYDLGSTLQVIHHGSTFNINKADLIKILNEESKTFVEIRGITKPIAKPKPKKPRAPRKSKTTKKVEVKEDAKD